MKKLTTHIAPSGALLKTLKNSLLFFWLLTLPASGFAPLFYSSGSDGQTNSSAEAAGVDAETGVSDSAAQDSSASGPSSGPSSTSTEAAPKSQVNFWLIAGASSGVNFSSVDNNKRQRNSAGFCNNAKYQIVCSNKELGQCNRQATLKSAEFTLLGLKPSGVS